MNRGWVRERKWFLLCALFAGCNCDHKPPPAKVEPLAEEAKRDTEDIAGIVEFAVSRTEPRVLDVVLIHGLGGNRIATWQATADPKTCWPKWLAEDLPDCGVYSVDYAASPVNQVGHSMPIQERAVNVLERLRGRKLGATGRSCLSSIVWAALSRSKWSARDWAAVSKITSRLPATSRGWSSCQRPMPAPPWRISERTWANCSSTRRA